MKTASPHVPSFPQLLQHRAKQSPQLPAVFTDKQVLTYGELWQQVGQIAITLQKKGIGADKWVAIYAHNRIEMVLALYGIWLLGIPAVPLSTRFPARVIPRYLKELGISILLTEDQFVSTIQGENVFSLESLLLEASGVSSSATETSWSEADPRLTVLLTSGTSGSPKAVVHRWSHHYFSARGANENIPFKAGERWLLSLPLYHVGGIAILFRALLGGAAVVVGDPGKISLKLIQEQGITHLSLVSTQLQRLVAEVQRQNIRPSLKAILLGGGPFPSPLIETAYNLHLPLVSSYGSTEMGSQITATKPGAPLQHLLTAGKPLPYRQVKIASDNEILVKGFTLCEGYWQNGQIRDPRDEAGWFHTGDVGKWTAEGYLKVVGRKDHMFISGGENIHPEEIEFSLMRHPGVEVAVVVDIPDPQYGARPVAFVRCKPHQKPGMDELMHFLESFLPRFKLPRHIWEMPQDEAQKLKPSRKKLREIALKLMNEKV